MAMHKGVVSAVFLLIVSMLAGLLGGCTLTSGKIHLDSSAPSYVKTMARELAGKGISTQWAKPADAGPTRSMSKPYEIFPRTYPVTWATKEIVHPGKGGYEGYLNQTGWVVANDKNDWADNIGRLWKQGHSHLDLYHVQDGTMIRAAALDGTQPGSTYAYNTSYTLTDHYAVWLAYDQTSALYDGGSAGQWQMVAYDLDTGHQIVVLGRSDPLWGTHEDDALPAFCVLDDDTIGCLFVCKDLASGRYFSRCVLLNLRTRQNRLLASSGPGLIWGTPIAAHGGICMDQWQERADDGSFKAVYQTLFLNMADGTVTTLFSSPLRLLSGLGEVLSLVKDPSEATDAKGMSVGQWQGTTDVWTYDCAHRQLTCQFRVPGDDSTGICKSAAVYQKGIAYAASQTMLQAYFYSYATGTISYTGNIIGSCYPPGTSFVLNKDQRAAFGVPPAGDVSGDLLVVTPR